MSPLAISRAVAFGMSGPRKVNCDSSNFVSVVSGKVVDDEEEEDRYLEAKGLEERKGQVRERLGGKGVRGTSCWIRGFQTR